MDEMSSVHLFLRHKAKDRMCDDFGPHTPAANLKMCQEPRIPNILGWCQVHFGLFFIESERDYRTLWASCSI